jgi:hypothetical protein
MELGFFPVRGKWTYAHRHALRALGCVWNGSAWVAPTAEVYAQAMAFADVPYEEDWTVTVHGDAGWKNGVGRWAWFCRSSAPPQVVEGVNQGETKDVFVAESLALYHGVMEAFKVWVPPTDKRGVLFLRSDNLAVVQSLSGPYGRPSPGTKHLARLVNLVPPNIRIDAKHVPAHGKTGGTAGWANARVDAASHLRGEVGAQRLGGK